MTFPLSAEGSSTSISPAGSFTSRFPPTAAAHADALDAPPSPRFSFFDPITANMGSPVTFEAPELPEETLMEVRDERTPGNSPKTSRT